MNSKLSKEEWTSIIYELLRIYVKDQLKPYRKSDIDFIGNDIVLKDEISGKECYIYDTFLNLDLKVLNKSGDNVDRILYYVNYIARKLHTCSENDVEIATLMRDKYFNSNEREVIGEILNIDLESSGMDIKSTIIFNPIDRLIVYLRSDEQYLLKKYNFISNNIEVLA